MAAQFLIDKTSPPKTHPTGFHTTPQSLTMSLSKRRKLNGSSHVSIPPTSDPPLRDRESSLSAPDDASQSQDASDSEASTTVTKSFQELGIIDSLCDACTSLGYKQPTPIQREAIPLALQGKDVGFP